MIQIILKHCRQTSRIPDDELSFVGFSRFSFTIAHWMRDSSSKLKDFSRQIIRFFTLHDFFFLSLTPMSPFLSEIMEHLRNHKLWKPKSGFSSSHKTKILREKGRENIFYWFSFWLSRLLLFCDFLFVSKHFPFCCDWMCSLSVLLWQPQSEQKLKKKTKNVVTIFFLTFRNRTKKLATTSDIDSKWLDD